MKCGHVASAKNQDGKPSCPICIGIKPGAEEVEETLPDLKGRIAVCAYCKSTRPSDLSLAFFEMGSTMDSFYCGCRGWD